MDDFRDESDEDGYDGCENQTVELVRSCADGFPEHLPLDFKIIVGDNHLMVNKQQLATVSPLIHNSPPHQKHIEVTDLSFEAVKTAIDFCFYRKITATTKTVIGILQFAHEFGIDIINDELINWPLSSITNDTFCLIWQYAFDTRHEVLIEACADHFRQNVREIVNSAAFDNLELQSAGYVLVVAYNLNGFLETLQCAFRCNAKSLTAKLENMIEDQFLADEFCSIVQYATNCDRVQQMKTCANYFSLHLDKIAELDEFGRLPPKAIILLFKFGFSFTRLYLTLTFAIENNVVAATRILEKYIFESCPIENFCDIALYAWKHKREAIKTKCYSMFRQKHAEIEQHPQFGTLEKLIVVEIIKRAFSYGTYWQVLEYTNENKLDSVTKFIEFKITIYLINFCAALKYAYAFERADIKGKCAKFYVDNRNAVERNAVIYAIADEIWGNFTKSVVAMNRNYG
uniref:BTB domain-containing protein n=1 Tax=Panagrellus redivivus TaxID=6233 RepID=A0A7E4ZSI0_PANRE